MALNDSIIERWLEDNISDEENIPNDECSDVDTEIGVQHVLEECSGSCSEIEAEEETSLQAGMVPLSSHNVLNESQSSSEDEVPLSEIRSRPRKTNYFGKNRYRWSSAPQVSRSRTLQHNIVEEKEGIKAPYKNQLNNSSSPLDIWQLFFTDEMLKTIVIHTNVKIGAIRINYQNQSCVQDVDLVELKAFLGILFYSAIFKENHTDFRSWYSSDGTGREIYRCVMSKNRFEVLLKAIRFDDAATRILRREGNASAPISELFDSFIKQCQAVYSIGTSACIDEMLLAFRGRCRFKMYMPKKPAKYGLKIQCLTDARTGYLLNAYIYLGKDSDGINLPSDLQSLKKPTQAVMRLVLPIEGSKRNVTVDNWYTSIEVANLLKQKQLTMVGTMRKNQREIPQEFLPTRYRNTDTTIFGFTKDITISSYVPKPNKAVITISTMHHTPTIDETTKKPEIILYYNQTKIGVDLLDQRCGNYTTSRRTRRWPLAIFYRILDISTSNSYLVSLSPEVGNTDSRFNFMKRLAKQLTTPHMERREQNVNLQRDIKISLRRILHYNEVTSQPAVFSSNKRGEDILTIRKTCSTCDPKKKRRTQHMCFECKRPICLECSNKMCIDCREKL